MDMLRPKLQYELSETTTQYFKVNMKDCEKLVFKTPNALKNMKRKP